MRLVTFGESDEADELVKKVFSQTKSGELVWKAEGRTAMAKLGPSVLLTFRGDEPGVYTTIKQLGVLGGGSQVYIDLSPEASSNLSGLLAKELERGARVIREREMRTKEAAILEALKMLGGFEMSGGGIPE